jgi:hypothetical protein
MQLPRSSGTSTLKAFGPRPKAFKAPQHGEGIPQDDPTRCPVKSAQIWASRLYKTTKIIQSSGVWTKFDHFSHDCWLKLRLAGLGSLPRPPETYARIPKKSWYPSNHRHGWPLKPMAPAGLLPFLGNLQMTWPAAMDLKDQFVRVEPTLL